MGKSKASRNGTKTTRTGLETIDPADWRVNTKGGYCCPDEGVFPTLTPEQQNKAQDFIKIQQDYFNQQKT